MNLHIHRLLYPWMQKTFCVNTGLEFAPQADILWHKLKCLTCGKRYKTPSALHEHQYVHSEKNFLCKKCGVNFLFKSWIQVHRCVHLKAKLHCCFDGMCGCEYKHPQDLHRHIAHHLRKKFGCTYSDYTTLERRMMKYHQL